MFWVILTLLIAVGIGVHIAARQPISKWWLNRRMYIHVDEACGAKRYEAEYAKHMRDTWGAIHPFADWWWPHPDLAGVMARPHWWRRRQYVWLGYKEQKPWFEPYRKTDVAIISITYTSEANHDDETMFTAIEKGVARAISQPWHPHLFERDERANPYARGLTDHRPDRDQVSLIVAERIELSHSVSALDILNGRANGHEDGQPE